MCEMDDKIFVCRDVVAFLGHAVGRSSSILQLNIASDNYAGGGVIANCTPSALSTGERITVAGLCVIELLWVMMESCRRMKPMHMSLIRV